MTFQRYRIRFSKQGDLRFLSHLDLVRTSERLFRRAGWALRMSEGFHPKPRMSFPSALAVGVAGRREVLELELVEQRSSAQLLAAVRRHLPAGLAFESMETVAAGTRKAVARRLVYEIPVRPEQRLPETAARIQNLLAQPAVWVARPNRNVSTNIRAFVQQLELAGNRLRICLRLTDRGSARPREILQTLGLDDLEQQGCFLTRVDVQLAPEV